MNRRRGALVELGVCRRLIQSSRQRGCYPNSSAADCLLYREVRDTLGVHLALIWTALGGPSLGHPKMRVEIRVTASLPEWSE
jgi:hypothetical protein